MSRSHLGNAGLLLALAAVAGGMAAWQSGPWLTGAPDAARGIAAALLVGLWALGSGAWLHRKRHARHADAMGEDAVAVVWASQTGLATELAEHTAQLLRAAGAQARVMPLEHASPAALAQVRRALFIVSTTGEGDPPDHAMPALAWLRDPAQLPSLQYAVLALGDRHYRHFAAFGRQVDAWLQRSGSAALFERIDVDAADPASLQQWQRQLEALTGTDAGTWRAPTTQPWRLVERRCLNPGSAGAAVHLLHLQPVRQAALDWQAGDIAVIAPQRAADAVDDWLRNAALDGATVVRTRLSGSDMAMPLRQALQRAQPPDLATLPERTPQAIADHLQPLPPREYSIASLPHEGSLQLLVRERRTPEGALGVASAWLTALTRPGDRIDLHIRRRPAFHPPDHARPLVLIGNGTGIAGLRAHLADRARAGATRCWLLFGERNAAHDLHFAEDLRAWQASGVLAHLDTAFSRDGGTPRHVQDLLPLHAQRLCQWVDDGATVLVCGSLAGMAPAVDAALHRLLGDAGMARLRAEGRYRRDVY